MERFFYSLIGQRKFFAFIELGRPWNGLLVFLILLIGYLLAINTLTAISLMGALAIFIIYMGAASLNDIFDFNVDKINMPYRPITRSLITKPEAFVFTIIMYFLGLLLSAFLSIYFLISVIFLSILSFFYSAPPLNFKNKGISGNLILSISTIFFPLYSGYVLANNFLMPSIEFLVLVFFLTLSFALISISKDLKDITGDRAFNKITIPVKKGIKPITKYLKTGLLIHLISIFSIYYFFLKDTLFLIISLILLLAFGIVINHLNRYSGESIWTIVRLLVFSFFIILFIFLF